MQQYNRPEAATGWHFLLGDDTSIHRLADAVGYEYTYDAEQQQYGHAAAIVLLKPDGRVSRYLYGIEFPPKDLKIGLLEAADGKTTSTLEHIILYCYRYDPKDGKYIVMANRVMQLGAVATILGLGSFLGFFWISERRKSRSTLAAPATAILALLLALPQAPVPSWGRPARPRPRTRGNGFRLTLLSALDHPDEQPRRSCSTGSSPYPWPPAHPTSTGSTTPSITSASPSRSSSWARCSFSSGSTAGRTGEKLLHPPGDWSKLEIFWTVTPVFFIVILFHIGFKGYVRNAVAGPDALEIRVHGKQWLWEFEYTNGMREVGKLKLPIDREVKMIISSDDVLHSFFIPEFRVKKDAVPGMYSTVVFETSKLGNAHVFCAEYCGLSHSGMLAEVEIVSQKDFDDYLKEGPNESRRLPRPERRQCPEDQRAKWGEAMFAQNGCPTCPRARWRELESAGAEPERRLRAPRGVRVDGELRRAGHQLRRELHQRIDPEAAGQSRKRLHERRHADLYPESAIAKSTL